MFQIQSLPRTTRMLPSCKTLDIHPEFLNLLSETQYKCSQGDLFEKLGVRWGSAALDFQGGTPIPSMRMQNCLDRTPSVCLSMLENGGG